MLVYHGTVKSKIRNVYSIGKVYVSPNYNFAEGYADSKAEDLKDIPVVLSIETNKKLYKDPEYEETDYKSYFIKGPLSQSEVVGILEV